MSTKAQQVEALRLADELAKSAQCYPQMSEDEPGGYYSEIDQTMDFAADELRRQHAKITELEEINTQLCEQADVAANAYRELEAAQAGREPLSDQLPQGFLSDVLTAAGLVSHGKRCKALGTRIGEAVEAIWKTSIEQREAFAAHGITQEKQGCTKSAS